MGFILALFFSPSVDDGEFGILARLQFTDGSTGAMLGGRTIPVNRVVLWIREEGEKVVLIGRGRRCGHGIYFPDWRGGSGPRGRQRG